MPENPKVFISYSHDSPKHKRWVSELVQSYVIMELTQYLTSGILGLATT